MTTSDAPGAPPPYRHYLREWRLFRGLKQEELGARLGVAKGVISRYESGDRKLNADTMFALMAALEITPAQFFSPPEDAAQAGLAEGQARRLLKTIRALIDEADLST